MTSPGSGRTSTFRRDIQGLRAVAVVSVLVFHIWPERLPGGYVGVDVFFVISGFFITGMLLREADATGTISLKDFYERRVRRLLPAANLVLMAIALVTPWLPPARWQDTASGIAASAIYVENWRLAWLAVDYLGAEQAASPVQHYWSLSIEEQFYVIWPLLLLVLAHLSRRAGADLRRVALVGLALVGALSFVASILVTRESPAAAYFVTHTRVWELTLGGLLALVRAPRWPAWSHEAMRLVGLAAIVVACFAFSGRTAFPGFAAMLPTAGAALVIAAGSHRPRVSSYPLLALRPAQYIGDISYSLYLWHWPVIVFCSLKFGPRRSLGGGIALAAACVLVAGLSKRFVEDPFRQRPGQRAAAKSLWPLGLGAASIAACVLAAGVIQLRVESQRSATGDPGAADPRYPGVAALTEGTEVPDGIEPYPPLAVAPDDKSYVYDAGCHVPRPDVDPNPCTYGDADSRYQVVLVGDSHAANWVPALAELAERRGWRLTTHTKSGCALLLRPLKAGGQSYDECLEWGQRVLDSLRASRPALVIWTKTTATRLWSVRGKNRSRRAMEEAIVDVWSELEATGAHVVALLDTPTLPFDPLDCLASRAECAPPDSDLFRYDPIRRAQERMPSVAAIDMNDTLCYEGRCPVVIGNIIVWRDNDHLTATYSRRLGPILGQRIDTALTGEGLRRESPNPEP